MRRTKDLGYHEASNRGGWMVGPLIAVLVVSFAAVFIDTIAIDDKNLDADSDHPGPLPAHVVQLSDHAYLIQEGAGVAPNDICQGGTTDGEGVDGTSRVPGLNAFFAECYVDQTWNNSKKNSGDFNFAEAGQKAISKPGWYLPSAIFILLSLIFPFIVGVNELVGRRSDKRKAKAQKKITYNKQLAQYRALQESWSKDEIDDLQFDKKLQKLVNDGFTVPDSGVFKNHA